jgi:hypothetical protein
MPFIVLKDHSKFRFLHKIRFFTQSKENAFVFEIFVDLLCNGATLVKQMQARRDIKDSWIMFNQLKQLKD